MKNITILLLLFLHPIYVVYAYTHADTLRGSNGRGRDWWKVTHYDLTLDFDLQGKTITGSNSIRFIISQSPHDSLQLDLQQPMILDSVICDNSKLPFANEDNVWWVKYPFSKWQKGTEKTIIAYYHGSPRPAKNPPWDGGFSWAKDSAGNQWVAVSCQGLGASVWWPCKDAQWEEPGSGVNMTYIVPDGMQCIGNGRLKKVIKTMDKNEWNWQVRNPINNYNVTFYIGDYVTWHDTLMGEKGKLDLDFWALRGNEAKAKKQFEVVKQMIHCFEYWMGPYPFYEDGYKLVEAPYLGMEHQGAIAYGNNYKMGYLGHDRTNTGVGMNFDYIIVHESGHEWFGNSITAIDIADNWIQEGITTYSESLFEERLTSKENGQKYCKGEWNNILNNTTIIGDYGVNNEGSGDMYDKGAAIMYMIRMLVNDDRLFRNVLRGLSETFYHRNITTQQVENYISTNTKMNLEPFFSQYLRTTKIPEVEYYIKDGQLYYKFNNVVDGFTLPVPVSSGKMKTTLPITAEWRHIKWKGGYNVRFSKDFLVSVK